MYSQTFFVTSVRASVDLPQIAASSVLSFFGAKMPLPAFFWANAILLLAAFLDALPARRFSAVIFFNAASKKSSSTLPRAMQLFYQPRALISRGSHRRKTRVRSLLTLWPRRP